MLVQHEMRFDLNLAGALVCEAKMQWRNKCRAQYDAASAYIRSQAHAGWTLIRSRYDDGGYSGGPPTVPICKGCWTIPAPIASPIAPSANGCALNRRIRCDYQLRRARRVGSSCRLSITVVST